MISRAFDEGFRIYGPLFCCSLEFLVSLFYTKNDPTFKTFTEERSTNSVMDLLIYSFKRSTPTMGGLFDRFRDYFLTFCLLLPHSL